MIHHFILQFFYHTLDCKSIGLILIRITSLKILLNFFLKTYFFHQDLKFNFYLKQKSVHVDFHMFGRLVFHDFQTFKGCGY